MSSDAAANQRHWDGVGATYDDAWAPPAKRALSERELDFVRRHVPAGDRLRAVDVGVGNGRVLDVLLGHPRVARVEGVDVSRSMLDVCAARFAGNPKLGGLHLADVGEDGLPVEPGIDLLTAIRVVKYSPRWARVVAERFLPHLSPGGTLVFTMPNARSAARLSRPYAVDYAAVTVDEVRAAVEAGGGTVVEVAGFARVPDLAYRRLRAPTAARALVGAERALERVLGPVTGARELFLAARRR